MIPEVSHDCVDREDQKAVRAVRKVKLTVRQKQNLPGAGDGIRTRDNLLGRHSLKLNLFTKFTEWCHKMFRDCSLTTQNHAQI